MIRAALVGLGEIGQVHLRALRESPVVELVALCDLDPELLESSRQGEHGFSDLAELLGEVRPDLVSVCLPHALHEPVALQAIEAGAHVLLEKPMAISSVQCDRIAGAAALAGCTVGVSHNQLFYGPHAELRRMIEEGELGRLRSLRAKLAIGGRYGAWRADPGLAGGGLAIDAGAHRIYLLEALAGPAHSVLAAMDEPGSEGGYAIVLGHADGVFSTIDACYEAPEGVFDDRVEVVGSAGLAEVAGVEALFEGFASGPALRVWGEGGWRERQFDDDWTSSVIASVQAFCAAVEEQRPPPVGAVEGRRLVAVLEAAYRSARGGERVEL